MTFNSNAIHTLNWSLRHTRFDLVRFHKKKSPQNSTCILNKSWPPTSKITIHITEHQRKYLLVYPRKQVQYWPRSSSLTKGKTTTKSFYQFFQKQRQELKKKKNIICKAFWVRRKYNNKISKDTGDPDVNHSAYWSIFFYC